MATQLSTTPPNAIADGPGAAENKPRLERIGERVTIQWLDDDQIMVAKLTAYDPKSIDQWAARCIEIRAGWPDGKLLLICLDLSAMKSSTNRYMQEKTDEVVKVRPEINSYNAILLQRDFVGQLIYLGIRTATTIHPNFRMQSFFQPNDALRWLRRCRMNLERKSSQVT